TESIFFFDTPVAILATRDAIAFNPAIAYPVTALLLGGAILVLLYNRGADRAGPALALRHRVLVGTGAAVLLVAAALRAVAAQSEGFEPNWSDSAAGSGAVELVRAGAELALSGHHANYRPAPGSATAGILRDLSGADAAPPYNVLVVLVESAGLLRNA